MCRTATHAGYSPGHKDIFAGSGAMELNQDQLEQFDTEGWVFLPEVFSQAEMDVLAAELPTIFAMDRDEVWREANGEAVRTAC